MKHFKLRYLSQISIAVVTVMSVSWINLFNKLDAPRKTEKIEIFIATNQYVENLGDLLSTGLKESGVKAVNIHAVAPESALFYTMLSSVGVLDSDLLVLPSSVIEGIGETDDFVLLDSAFLKDYAIAGDEYEYWTNTKGKYGIKIYDAQTKFNYLDKYFWINSAEDYYIAVNTNTVNSAPYSKVSENTSNRAFLALSFLLNN